MSLADFSQYAQDHAHIFVYVTALGETSGALYGAVLDAVENFPPIRPCREECFIFVRLRNRLPRWARGGQQPWQEFQPYKRVLGLLAVTQCHDRDDLAAAEEAFENVCRPFSETLLVSQCIVYGSRSKLEKPLQARKKLTLVDFDNTQSYDKLDVKIDTGALKDIVTGFSEFLFCQLQQCIQDLKSSLEVGKPMALRSPLDGKEAETDEDAKLSRTKLMGRMHKHIADLHLLCGQLQPACDHFGHAITQLSRDNLWAGSANEGLGAMYMMKDRQDELFGQKTAPLSIQSNLIGGFLKVSARITGPKLSLKASHLELSRRKGGGDGVVGGGGEGTTMPNGKPSVHRQPKNPLADVLSLESIEDDSMEDVDTSEPSEETDGAIETEGDDETRRLLQKDLVVDRFTRAEMHYKKAGPTGGVPRIELLFKFARYLVSQQRHKAATEVLQRVFWTKGFMDEQDKTTLYETIAEVFESMGYHRKASLFLHWAAKQAHEIATSLQDNYKAYNLLLQSLPGYKLTTSADAATTSAPSGWPLLQAALMKDLVYLTQKTDQNGRVIQLSCMLLQNLHVYMKNSDLMNVVQYLDDVTKTPQLPPRSNESAPANHSPKQVNRRLSRYLSSDSLLSPLPLTEFPKICTFRPKQFPPHLRPYKSSGSTTSGDGPFIVSQLQGKRPQRRGGSQTMQRRTVLWVVHDPAEISMDVTNPLDFELRVENMKLLWNGVAITACPSSLSLPAQEKQDFTLTALPREPGELELIGYEHTVFGVHSKCSMKVEGNPVIKVIPTLPQLRLKLLPMFHVPASGDEGTSSENSPLRRGDAQRSSVGPRLNIDMMDGESCSVDFKLECQKQSAIESLSLIVDFSTNTANHKPDEFCHVTCPTPDAINTLLPIGKNEKRNFLVEIVAKFPTYYRVKNDFVSTLSRQQPYAEHGASMPLPEEPIPQKIPFKRKGSPATKRSPPRNSPDGSPVGKQPPEKLKDLTKHPHHLHMLDQPLSAPAVVGTPKLMDSLNIDFPKVSKVTSSLQTSTVPSSLIHGMSPIVSKRGIPNLSRVGSTKSSRKHYDEWDFNQFMDKRASIRSDPGECKREGGGIFSRSPRGSGISTPLQKSPSRSGSLFDDTEFSPLKTGKEGGIFTFNNQNSSPRLSVGSLSSQKSPSRTPHRKGATAIKKNVISLPSDLRHNTPSILPTEVPVLASFTLHYSGGEGRKAGYHRRMESSVKVKVCPSLYFDDFHISSVIRRKQCFSLSFYVHNKSGHTLNVTCCYSTGKEGRSPQQYLVALLPRQKDRVEMILQRFNLPGHPANTTVNESNIAQLYSDHLAKMVRVHWEVEGVRRSGVGTLEGMRLPCSLLHIIQPLLLLIDVEVNGKQFAMDSESSKEYSVGSPVNICITLTNNASCTVGPSWLLVDLCEFFGQQITRDVTGRMTHSGNLLQRIPQLKTGETYEHRMTLVFFYKSNYQVNFQVYMYSQSQRDSGRHESDLDCITAVMHMVGTRTLSPILRGSTSPPPVGGPPSEFHDTGGSIFPPVRINSRPLRCQLAPTSKQSENGLPTLHQGKLLSLAEVGRLARSKEDLSIQKSSSRPVEQAPHPLRPRSNASSFTSSGSVHKRLSRLCKRHVTGPVISLQIVEPRINSQTPHP